MHNIPATTSSSTSNTAPIRSASTTTPSGTSPITAVNSSLAPVLQHPALDAYGTLPGAEPIRLDLQFQGEAIQGDFPGPITGIDGGDEHDCPLVWHALVGQDSIMWSSAGDFVTVHPDGSREAAYMARSPATQAPAPFDLLVQVYVGADGMVQHAVIENVLTNRVITARFGPPVIQIANVQPPYVAQAHSSTFHAPFISTSRDGAGMGDNQQSTLSALTSRKRDHLMFTGNVDAAGPDKYLRLEGNTSSPGKSVKASSSTINPDDVEQDFGSVEFDWDFGFAEFDMVTESSMTAASSSGAYADKVGNNTAPNAPLPPDDDEQAWDSLISGLDRLDQLDKPARDSVRAQMIGYYRAKAHLFDRAKPGDSRLTTPLRFCLQIKTSINDYLNKTFSERSNLLSEFRKCFKQGGEGADRRRELALFLDQVCEQVQPAFWLNPVLSENDERQDVKAKWEDLIPYSTELQHQEHKDAFAVYARRLALTGFTKPQIESELSKLRTFFKAQGADVLPRVAAKTGDNRKNEIRQLMPTIAVTVEQAVLRMAAYTAESMTRSPIGVTLRNPTNAGDTIEIATWYFKLHGRDDAHPLGTSPYETGVMSVLKMPLHVIESSQGNQVSAIREKALLSNSTWQAFIAPLKDKRTKMYQTSLRIFRTWVHVNAFIASHNSTAGGDHTRRHLEEWLKYRLNDKNGNRERMAGHSPWDIVTFAAGSDDNAWNKDVNAFLDNWGKKGLISENDRLACRASLDAFRQWEQQRESAASSSV